MISIHVIDPVIDKDGKQWLKKMSITIPPTPKKIMEPSELVFNVEKTSTSGKYEITNMSPEVEKFARVKKNDIIKFVEDFSNNYLDTKKKEITTLYLNRYDTSYTIKIKRSIPIV